MVERKDDRSWWSDEETTSRLQTAGTAKARESFAADMHASFNVYSFANPPFSERDSNEAADSLSSPSDPGSIRQVIDISSTFSRASPLSPLALDSHFALGLCRRSDWLRMYQTIQSRSKFDRAKIKGMEQEAEYQPIVGQE